MPFAVRADRRLIRSTAPSRRFVRVEITAPEVPRSSARIPVNLAFVIDRSGSMAGDKIGKAREAAIQGIRTLRPEDRFAVVSFDDHVDVVVPSTPATSDARAAAERRIANIGDRGSTDLHAGWLAGCEEIRRALSDDALGRCLLLTDGRANAGVTAPHEILARAADLRQRRITTSAFGVGADFDEGLLAGIAEAGGGNFHFVEGASQIPEFIGAEVGEALAVTARDVVLVVEAGEGALVESLNDFPCTQQGEAWRIELGSLYGGQMLDPVLRLTLPGGPKGATREVRVRVEDREGALGAPSGAVSFTWAGHAENDAQERDRLVDRRVAFLFAARAGRDGLAHNRAGDYEAARRVLKACRERIRRYAGDDPELQAIVRDLEEKTELYGADMDPFARKFGLYSELRRLKSRPAPRVTQADLRAARSSSSWPPGPSSASSGLPSHTSPWPTRSSVTRPCTTSRTTRRGSRARSCRRGTRSTSSSAPPPPDRRTPCGSSSPSAAWATTGSRTGTSCATLRSSRWPTGTARPPSPPRPSPRTSSSSTPFGSWSPSYAPEKLMHDETRGCFFDFCESRTDVRAKLSAGRLCVPCRQALTNAGIPGDRVLNLVNAVRLLAAMPQAIH